MDTLTDSWTLQQENPNISEIIENGAIAVCFQPIVSVSRKTVSGLEGLIRGIDSATNRYISPNLLFSAAASQNLTLELDRLCRERVMEAFANIRSPEKLLFLNIEASILDEAVGSNYLITQVMNNNINPRNIVIEINETKVQGIATLKRFTDTYRQYGFLVALDDVGTGFSNMDRILLVKPDIIKLDISLVKNIHNDYYKQGVFKSLVNLASEIGALVIAEGVETQEEAIQVLRLGGHMIQGFYFSRPQETFCEPNRITNTKINLLCENFNRYINKQMTDEWHKNRELSRLANAYIKLLKNLAKEEFNAKLMDLAALNKELECLYILDQFGVQISNTILCNSDGNMKENMIFYCARLGTDHSMEKYYYPLVNLKLKKYITDPYLSLATGNICKTISYMFTNREGRKYILCLDIKMSPEEEFEYATDFVMPNSILNSNGKAITDKKAGTVG